MDARDNLGRKVEFGDVVMPMTTNIGADHALRVGTGPGDLTEEEAYELTIGDLKKAFRTEFLNRFEGRENIILFRKLNMDTIEKIVFREIFHINAFYAQQSIDVRFPEAQLREFCAKVPRPRSAHAVLPGRIKRIEAMIVEKTMADAAFGGTLDIGFDGTSRNFTSNWIPHDRKAA